MLGLYFDFLFSHFFLPWYSQIFILEFCKFFLHVYLMYFRNSFLFCCWYFLVFQWMVFQGILSIFSKLGRNFCLSSLVSSLENFLIHILKVLHSLLLFWRVLYFVYWIEDIFCMLVDGIIQIGENVDKLSDRFKENYIHIPWCS